MYKFIIIFAHAALVASLSSSDRKRLITSMDSPIDSLKMAYQVTVSRNILKQSLSESTCAFVAEKVQLNLDDLYYASFISKIQGCTVNIAGKEDFLRAQITEEASIKILYKAVSALSNFKISLEATLHDSIAAALKKEDTVMAHSLAYLTAASLPGDISNDLLDSIEDIAHRADTIGSAMSFDGGLIETSMFLKGTFALSKKADKAVLSGAITKKIYNYILGSKDKAGQSNSFYVLMSMDVLSKNGFVMPTRIQTLENSLILSAESPSLKLALVNSLGEVITGAKLSIKSAISPVSGKNLFASGVMSESEGVFKATGSSLSRGIYNIEVVADTPTGYLTPENVKLNAKVVSAIKFAGMILKLIDIDDNRIITSSDLSKTPIQTRGDLSTRLTLNFHIADGAENVALHQVFVRFTNVKTKQQVYFVAQADLNKKYSIDINMRAAAAKSFGSVSGDYIVDIIAGDATLPKTEVFNIAKLSLELPESKPVAADLSRAKKPEIQHMFREQEKRPPQAVSMFFTALVLLPAAVLLIVWMKLGANLSSFTFSLSGLGFHLGLLSIIALYVNFFLGTNMFVTMKYLTGVGIVTFLCGHRLLSSIAAAKKAK